MAKLRSERRARRAPRSALRRLAPVAVCGWALAGCGPESTTRPRVSPGDAPEPGAPGPGSVRAEDVWLGRIGTGPAQTARVCQNGARDRVVMELCGDSAQDRVTSLGSLYAALGLGEGSGRYVATTTHSLGLSARSVSAANPRTFVFVADRNPIPYQRLVAVAFARGEPLVELVALDGNTLDYNFYLLRFELECSSTFCTPEDLLTERIESGWKGFTLYSDRELADTALDCVACHQPFGAGTRKQLLMRQTASPWLHWGDFRGRQENQLCPEKKLPDPGRFIQGDGLELLVRLEGASGRHAGISVAELVEAPSGERFSLFLTDAENTVRARDASGYPYGQLDYDSTSVLCELLDQPSSPTWERARAESLERGLPVPYFAHDLLDAEKRAELVADRPAFLTRHENEHAFDVAKNLISSEAQSAVGFVPREQTSAPEILRAMCVRCHASGLDRRLARARFDAGALDRVTPETARTVRERLSLPKHSPELMPPLRSGELPDWAIARVSAYLREHCSDPSPGACD